MASAYAPHQQQYGQPLQQQQQYGQPPQQQQQYAQLSQQQQQYAPPPQQQQYAQPPQQQQFAQPPQQQQYSQPQQQQQQQAAPQQQQQAAPQQQTQEPPAPQVVDSENAGPISVDTQHDDMVHDAQLDYYGAKMATCSSDRTVKIFDVVANQHSLSATLTGHEGPVWEVAWAHPKFGTLLASCSFDGTVMIHRETRPRVWTLLYTHQFHASSVNGVEFAPHEFGLVLACASSDGKVSVLTHQPDDSWAVEYFKDNALGVTSLSWGHYNCLGSKVQDQPEAAPQMRLVTGGCDNNIRFWRHHEDGWKEDEAEALGDSESHSDWVRDVAWMPSRVPQNTVASCSEDHKVIVWTQTQAGGMWEPSLLNSFEAPVWRLSWSVNGSILAVSSGDSTVTLWKSGLDGIWKQVSTVDDESAVPAAPGPPPM